ncbi:amidohydrolase [Haloactinomyces albus]|uniref:Amidohydrolase YtcJ n=1 Tax=Haloactinomyces albus TaxID=1352928 RepID=A0AAE4CRJ1_9ACTN|nr:amidohydrolase [Haloactinomyces albus]MDR7303763.1 putative amidohydrolase YtcJ [Haloactinomyces albus]
MSTTTDHAVWYSGGHVFTGDPQQSWTESLVLRGSHIVYVGPDASAADYAGADTTRIDLQGSTVLPGFVDGHAHVLMTGQASLHAHLTDAGDLAEIHRRVTTWASNNPDAPRVLGRGWLFSSIPEGRPTKEMLDAIVPDRPVYLDANDYHSVWVNTAALAELGITRDTPDPVGGRIVRDPATGEPTGHLEETAAQNLVWPFIADATTDEDRDAALVAANTSYLSSGVTCAVDMALDEPSLAAMVRAERANTLNMRIVGHWLIRRAADPAQHLAQIKRAAELAATHHSDTLRITGVKFVVDGVIDGCTASMLEPYADGTSAEPIWDLDHLAPAVAAADAAGLQVALHAIGDKATRIALDALEHAHQANGPRPRRHRIEHLEYVDPADVPRLAQLGITASMQPVHADPAIRANWAAMLGDARAERGFAWPEFTGTGARLAFGTDAPTAPHPPLPNLYIANTRRSPSDPSLLAPQPHLAVPLPDAVRHATTDSAWACGSETALGKLESGLLADFIVLDRNPFNTDPGSLLQARVLRTVIGGSTVWRA